MRFNLALKPLVVWAWPLLGLCPGAALAEVEVIKSPNDKASYEAFVLPNELKVLAVSDPDTDKAAAALAVNVGSNADPKTRNGLAHFLEHMLFLGTEKYPTAGEYQSFIRSHGGSHNAYTSFNFTTYFFDIDRDYLGSALDRFSQFFTAPSFTLKYVEREVHAVDSEFRSKLLDDGRRKLRAQKELINPEHPYSGFQGGNLETLSGAHGRPIREELLEFYRQHYSAGLMALVVIGKEPLPVLRQWITERFSEVPNSGAEPPRIAVPLFEPGRLPVRLDVVPTKDRRTMQLTFPIPPVREHYRAKPAFLISGMLGYEGKGSLLSLLKGKGWVDGLSAGVGISDWNAATFNVSMSLTQEGLVHIEEIGAHVFEYIRLIREQGVTRWAFEEQQKLAAIDFRFKEKSEPIGYATGLATSLHLYPIEDVLRGPHALDVFDAELIRQYLDHLSPEKALLTLVAKGLDTDRKASWFETPYKASTIPKHMLALWRDAGHDARLALPKPNPFIPGDLALKPIAKTAAIPTRLRDAPGIALWHQQDETFSLPKSDFFFSVRSQISHDTARHAVLTRMYINLVNDQLNEFSYPAVLAGLGYDLYQHVRGFSLRMSGYSDKAGLLLSRIVKALRNPVIDPERFAIIKERRLRSLRNVKHNRPYSLAMSEVTRLLLEPSWSEEQRIAALAPIEIADLESFIPELLERISLVMLSHGNVDQRGARELADIVEDDLLDGVTPARVADARVVRLEPGDLFIRQLDVEHGDSALSAYYQGASKTFESRARFALLTQVVSSPFFNELRTEKQLGYIVFSTASTLMEVPGISFVVQSPVAGPIELQTYTDTFLQDFVGILAQMSESEFEAHKSGLLTRILEEEKTLQDRSLRYWREIDKKHFDFDSLDRLADAVRGTHKQQFQAFYADALLGAKRKRIVVWAVGDKHKGTLSPEAEDKLVPDSHSFRRDKKFFSQADGPSPDPIQPVTVELIGSSSPREAAQEHTPCST